MPTAGLCWSLAMLAALLLPGTSLDCNDGQYSWYINSKKGCCPKCPAGQYLINRCKQFNTLAVCGACYSGTFTDTWNIHLSCPSCGECSQANGLEIEKGCTAKSNVKCTCRPGYSFYTASPTEKCFKICNEGEQFKQGDSNTCEPCPPGFYSNEKGTKLCRAWTRCTDNRQYLIKNGSRTADAVCSSSDPRQTTTSQPRQTTTSQPRQKSTSEPRQTTTSKGSPPASKTTSSTTLLRITTGHSVTTAGKPIRLKKGFDLKCHLFLFSGDAA
ncbi:tumor necrosis factor receptor superfamily member 5-like isoform X2 [Rhinoraja longicauda]